MTRSLAPRLVLAALLLAGRVALADAPAPFHRDPNAASGAFVLGQTSLVVEREALVLRCAQGTFDPTCTFEARYRVRSRASHGTSRSIHAPDERTPQGPL